jgi:DNA/RNA-binding domain of Phe-tRNA-synthetase-like protein
MPLKIESSLEGQFPGLQVVELEFSNLRIKDKNESLESLKIETEERIRKLYGSLEAIRDEPIFRSYRDFFWRVGIDPTKTRPAAEALTRRIVGGRRLPTINTLVDAYNLASVSSRVAIAAFDGESISVENLFMRKARVGEKFRGIAMKTDVELRGVEIVIEDQKSLKLIAVYPYRDSDESKVTNASTKVSLMMCGVPGIPKTKLEEAAELSQKFIRGFCL